MVYAQEHVLLRFNGHFGGASTFTDRWSVGVRLGQPSLPTPLDSAKMQTLVNSAHSAAKTLQQNAAVAAGTTCFYDQCAGATIGPSGKYAPSGQLTTLSPLESTPGLGTPTLPWNTALVVSLRTAVPRGRGSNGRVYWPATSLAVLPATGRIAAGNVANRIAGFKTFLDALNVAANTYLAGTRVIVASNVGTGLNAIVTGIRSDDRLDSIERRENDQASVWSTATLA